MKRLALDSLILCISVVDEERERVQTAIITNYLALVVGLIFRNQISFQITRNFAEQFLYQVTELKLIGHVIYLYNEMELQIFHFEPINLIRY